MDPGVRLRCFGCGAEPEGPHPFACPNRGQGDVDHVVRRELPAFAPPDRQFNHPFLRYRHRLASWHRAQANGWSDEEFVNGVMRLDHAVAAVDGAGFQPSPVVGLAMAATALGVREVEALVTADDVSGSHKARHLFGVALHLMVAGGPKRELAIASCGNAALAAAVVARALEWPLRVFIPTDAPATVVARLHALQAQVQICERDPKVPGDPTYHAFRAAVDGGALPFCCQGPDNGLTIEGGMTLGYRWAEYWASRGQVPDHLLIQVGGGALGSAIGAALREAHAAGCIPRLPRIHVVQTHGAFPMKRALERLAGRGWGVAA
ncbi:MAG: pyridoxal-phosphate dependent enzyme, partial [Myxococcales bacterium]|nr:pyridoxal-phosphate dependent enzyme [Myxococcales bacterium]